MRCDRGNGFVLIGVLLLLIGLVAIALSMTGTVTIDHRLVESEQQRTQLHFTAQAGMAHAHWLLQRNHTCTNYGSIGPTPLGAQSYEVEIVPDAGTPVTITSRASLADGGGLSVTASGVPMYAGPVVERYTMDSNGRSAHIEGDSGKQDHNHGGDKDQMLGGNSDDEIRLLLAFDVGPLPDGATITNATLSLHVSKYKNPPLRVYAHRVTRNWAEQDVTWTNRTGTTMFGKWVSPGGDYDSDPIAEFVIDGTGTVDVDVTALVQAWTNGSDNDGMLFRAALAPENDKVEIATGYNNDDTQHPAIAVTYACLCGSSCVTP